MIFNISKKKTPIVLLSIVLSKNLPELNPFLIFQCSELF